MARSGSIDFNLTRNQIIGLALGYIGKKELGEEATAAEIQDASLILNAMVKAWHGDGVHLWKRVDATLFLAKGTQSYTLSSTGDHCTSSYVETTTTAAEVANATVIEVTSSAGMTAADNVGIVLDDGTLHWDTIASVDSSLQITITTGIASAAASGKAVYAYTTKINRPLRIIDAYRRTGSNDVPVEIISKSDYNELTPKNNQATVNQIYYTPELDSGKLWVWQTTDTVTDKIVMTVVLPIEDFDAALNAPDLPVEWTEAIYINLAYRLAPHFSIPLEERIILKEEARLAKEIATNFDQEPNSVFIHPQSEW